MIRTYRAVDEPDSCEEYLTGHVQVLKDYGIENITSNNNVWIHNSNTYCIVAYDRFDEMIGGIRIQVKDEKHLLPVEEAIAYIDPRIYDMVDYYKINGGVGELCGLWIARRTKGMGLGLVLVRAAISIVNQLNFQTLTGICAEYSLKMFEQVGFVVNKDLGREGKFAYPNENYIARVVGILNSLTLESANIEDRRVILSLRSQPNQIREEKGKTANTEVNYNLVGKFKNNSEKVNYNRL